MRKVSKRSPPSAGVRGGSWQQASLRLRGEIGDLTIQQARVRARQAYEDEVVREPTRAALADEQASLCAFCEGRIAAEVALDSRGERPQHAIRVAHWTPIEVEPSRALTWANLFASCSHRDSCDQAQKSQDPAMATIAERDWSVHLEFETSGAVVTRGGAPTELVRAIGQRLDPEDPERWAPGVWNLNHRVLREARKAAIAAELQQAHASRDRRAVPKAAVIDERLEALAQNPQPYQTALTQALRRWRG